MKNSRRLFMISMVSLATTVGALAGDDAQDTRLVPAYVAESNDQFSVCQLNLEKKVILRWKGVIIPRTELPKVGPYRPENRFGYIFERDEKPQNAPPTFHHYGTIPYPIEDIDPPMESCLTKKGVLLLGFKYLHGTFYAIKEVDKPELKGQISKKNWSKVIRIEVPKHRVQEAKNLLREVVKEKDAGEDIFNP